VDPRGYRFANRSLITVAMLITLRAHSELAIHAPAAIRNGADRRRTRSGHLSGGRLCGFSRCGQCRDVVREALEKAGMLS